MAKRRLGSSFFARDARIVAQELLGCVIIRKEIHGKELHAMIVETEAYLDEQDPGSWARHGKRNDNKFMWSEPGTILIKNVHKYKMLNFVTGRVGKPEAVLIRAVEPLNFEGRCSGPGLLTLALKISRNFNGMNIAKNKEFWIEMPSERKHKIVNKKRIGLREDSKEKRRFYIKGNGCVSRK